MQSPTTLAKKLVKAPRSLLRIPLLLSFIALATAIFTDLPYDFVLLRILVLLTCLFAVASLWRPSPSSAQRSVRSAFSISAGLSIVARSICSMKRSSGRGYSNPTRAKS
jgi:hypothetical protein